MHTKRTLDEYIIENQNSIPDAAGEFSDLLRHIGIAGKIINRIVNKAGLLDVFGNGGNLNATGDEVQKLDLYANDLMIEYLQNTGVCAGVGSEELEQYVGFESRHNRQRKYVVVLDPLDGSSNIDVNISVGTIFGIYKRKSAVDDPVDIDDFCQKGEALLAAGYILYGTSTILVYTTGNGVNGFTYDPGIGEFCLSHPSMVIPETGKTYAVNQAYYSQFSNEMRNFIDKCAGMGLVLRYAGSMVADIHRALCQGGIFLYPSTSKNPDGKLRMLYECNPLSFVVEQAGGSCVDERGRRILEIPITQLHQRSTILIGSAALVGEALSQYR
ncbi:MAG: class 1 fructose-bisphosphatase [Saprospiraceae bacterium]|jgi:fructose-1,6-bisphosphatase I|nr:class 1 fructose-bisphosphatase [Saprospiraceae bacterium]MBP9208872.1 class 1 fructose-bisphosphatase [Saprospiraceae bacterium]MBV6472056.1 Fructose-1,6-bisphosphatase class 1 [Saprospiraceae bacterium]